jgi:hypothetical protein
MAKNKTVASADGVEAFLTKQSAAAQADLRTVMAIMAKVTGEAPRMWGPSIIGYGTYHYRYESGREGDFLITGMSPRKANLTLYLMLDLEKEASLLAKLGPHSIGKSCLYIKRTADVDLTVLERLIAKGVKAVEKQRVR